MKDGFGSGAADWSRGDLGLP